MSRPRFLADEDFRHDVVSAVVRHDPTIDFPTVRAVGLAGTPDAELLAYAAEEGRILVSHDVSTMPDAAAERINAGLNISGLLMVPQSAQWRAAIECLLVIVGASEAEEWKNVIDYLPW